MYSPGTSESCRLDPAHEYHDRQPLCNIGMERPGWDEYYLGIAQAASARGDCIRRKVGAVLVKQVGIWTTATSIGYNGSLPGGPSCLAGECARCLDPNIPSGEQYGQCIEYHAEDNAVANAMFDVVDSTMYITCAPCGMCQILMDEHGIKRAVWPGGEMEF